MGYANTGTIISVHSFWKDTRGSFVNVLIPAKSDGKLLEIEIEIHIKMTTVQSLMKCT